METLDRGKYLTGGARKGSGEGRSENETDRKITRYRSEHAPAGISPKRQEPGEFFVEKTNVNLISCIRRRDKSKANQTGHAKGPQSDARDQKKEAEHTSALKKAVHYSFEMRLVGETRYRKLWNARTRARGLRSKEKEKISEGRDREKIGKRRQTMHDHI